MLTFCSAAVSDLTKISVKNSLGENVIFERADNETERYNEGDLIINGESSKVLETDLMATNGVLHIIDTPLTNRTGTVISNRTFDLDPVKGLSFNNVIVSILPRYSFLISFGKT